MICGVCLTDVVPPSCYHRQTPGVDQDELDAHGASRGGLWHTRAGSIARLPCPGRAACAGAQSKIASGRSRVSICEHQERLSPDAGLRLALDV